MVAPADPGGAVGAGEQGVDLRRGEVRDQRPLASTGTGRRVGAALVRYADDLVVMCRTETEAQRAIAALRTLLSELGLEPKQAKTRIVHLREGGQGFDFLGRERLLAIGRRRLTGSQQLPARLGRLLPLRKRGPPLRQDRHLRARAALALPGEAAPQAKKLRLVDGRLRVTEPDGPDQPQRTRRRATTEPGRGGQSRMPAVKDVG